MKLTFAILFLCVLPGFLFPVSQSYKSNSVGMVLEEIDLSVEDDFTYILFIEIEGGKETRILKKDGKEIKRWEKVLVSGNREESYYVNGTLDTFSRYGPAGLLNEEITYKEGEILEKREYSYLSGKLSEIALYDKSGNLISSTQILRTGAGRLREMKRTQDSENDYFSTYRYNHGNLIQEWHGTQEEGDLFRFSDTGERLAREHWQGEKMNSEIKFLYSENKNVSSLEHDFLAGSDIYREYDEKSRVLLEREVLSGKLVQETIFRYVDGNTVEKKRKSPGLKETWKYEYNTEGTITREEYYKYEELKKVTLYTGDDTYYEDIYRNGAPFLRVYYQNEQKIKEEVINPINEN